MLTVPLTVPWPSPLCSPTAGSPHWSPPVTTGTSLILWTTWCHFLDALCPRPRGRREPLCSPCPLSSQPAGAPLHLHFPHTWGSRGLGSWDALCARHGAWPVVSVVVSRRRVSAFPVMGQGWWLVAWAACSGVGASFGSPHTESTAP